MSTHLDAVRAANAANDHNALLAALRPIVEDALREVVVFAFEPLSASRSPREAMNRYMEEQVAAASPPFGDEDLAKISDALAPRVDNPS